MAENKARSALSKSAQKAKEILTRNITTPTGKAMGGDVSSVIQDIYRDKNIQTIGALIGSMVTDKALPLGTDFKSLINKMAGSNLLKSINEALTSDSEKTVYGQTVKISTAIQSISDSLKNILSIQPSETGESGEGSSLTIAIDTTKAVDLPKILNALKKIDDKDVQNLHNLVDYTNKLSTVDLSYIKTNFVDPANSLTEVDYKKITKNISGIVSSDLFENLEDIFTRLDAIQFSNSQYINAFEAIQQYAASMILLGEFDPSSLENTPKILEILSDIFSEDQKTSINAIITSINGIENIDYDSTVDTFAALVDSSANLSLLPEIITEEKTQEISKSIDNLSVLMEQLKTKINFSDEDGEKIKNAMTSMTQSCESIESSTESYSNSLKNASENSESNNKYMDSIVSNYDYTLKKGEELKAKIEDSDQAELCVALESFGEALALMGMTMLIGGFIFMKRQEMVMASLKFAITLAAFIGLVMIPIVLINYIYKKLLIKQQSMDQVVAFIASMAAVLIIGGLIYTWFPNIGKGAMRFAIDLTKFLFLLMIPIAFIGFFVRSEGDVDAMGNFVVKCALVMLIGALFVNAKGGSLVKSSLMFGLALAGFIALVMLPVIFFALFIREGGGEMINAIGNFIIKCTIVMLIGALFMMSKKLVSGALMFGVLLMAFIGLVLLPIWLFKGIFKKENLAESLENLTKFILVCSFVLMLGGLFMLIGGGKLALAAMQFAKLLTKFIFQMVIIIAVASLLGGPWAALSVRSFRKLVWQLTLVLIGGALCMMIPGFAKAAIGFAILISAFVLVMGLIMIFIGKRFTNEKILFGIKQFGLMVLLLTLAMIVGGLVVAMIGIKPMIEFSIMVTIMVGVVVGFVWATSKLKPEQMTKSMMCVVMFSISMLLLGIAIYIAKKAVQDFEYKDILKLFLIVGGLIGVFALFLIPYLSAAVLAGSQATILMAIALASLSGALWLVHIIVGGKLTGTDIFVEVLKLEALILLLAVVFSLIGPLSILINPAAVAIMLMSVALTLFSGAMFVVNFIFDKIPNILENIAKLCTVVIQLGLFFTLVGLLVVGILLGNISLVLMTPALILFSGALWIVSSIIQNCPTIMDDIKILMKVTGLLSLMFSAIGLLIIPIKFGSIALGLIAGVLLLLDAALYGVIGVIELASGIDDEQISSVGKMIGSFFTTLASSLPGPIKLAKLILSILALSAVISPLTLCISALGITVKDFANLSIPTKWNKDGKAIEYRQLDEDDFKAVPKNISALVDCMLTGLDNVYKNHKQDIDEIGKVNGFAAIFGGTKNKLLNTIRVASMLGRLIGSLATNVSSIAKLMIPTKWNDQGVAIAYEPMTEQHFLDAGNGIARILSVVGDALVDFATKHADWVEDFKNNDKGLFGGSGNSTFGAVLRMSIGLGEMIASIAQSIQNYAELKIPIDWNSDGSVKKYRHIGEDDFKEAAANIETIMGVMGKAVADGYENGYSKALKKTEKLEAMFNSIKSATQLVSDVAGIIQTMAEMRFTVLENGQEVVKQLGFDIIYDASENIRRVLTFIPEAIKSAADNVDKDDMTKIKDLMWDLKPMGEFIGSIVNAIQAYADLKIPTKYDKEGKPVEFKPIDLNQSLLMMRINLSSIISGMGVALAAAYNEFKGKDGSAQTVADALESLKPIGDIFTSIINSIQAYADFKLPIYGTGDKASEVVGYKTFFENGEDLSSFLGKMSNNMLSMIRGMVDAITNPQLLAILDDIVKKPRNRDFEKYFNALDTINGLISSVIETVKAYSELKFPKGDLDKDGKPKNGYSTLGISEILDMRINIANLLIALPSAVKSAFDTLKITLGENVDFNSIADDMNDWLGKCNNIMKSAVDIVKSYADLKIPKSFDKDGNVKSYIQLSEKEIDEMAKNIYTIISAVPASITAIYNMFKNNGIEKDQINFINDTIQFSSAGIMDGSKVLVEKYAEIKKELKDGNEIKKTLGAFLLNIGRMYVDFLDLFKKAGYVPDDIKAVYEYLEVIISKKTIYQIKDIAEGLVTISELMHSIKESVVDNIIMDSAKITLAWKPDFTIIATDINNIIEGVKQVIDLIDNTVDSRDFRRTIRNSRSALDYLDSVKQQYSNCIEQIINIVNDSILITDSVAKYALDSDNDTVKGKIEKIVSTTYDIISSLNSVINENDNKVDLSKKMQRKFNALSDSFHGYEESMKTISQTFNEIIKTFGPNTSSISDFIMVKHSIGTAINTIMDISRMIDNPDQIDEVLNGENGNRKSRFEMLKEKVTKKSIKSIFGDFAQMSNDFSRSIEDLVNAFTKTQSLEEASFYNMDFLLWIIQEHSKTITESQVEKLEKESESIERYTKAIDKVSVSKLNTLIRLFQAMDKWAHSVGNLDEFTRALSDELASSLQQLTSEINEAKDVIKKADEQRKERQKQLDESIEKVGKLMNQTLHVNVSSGSDDTIGAAYENPRD